MKRKKKEPSCSKLLNDSMGDFVGADLFAFFFRFSKYPTPVLGLVHIKGETFIIAANVFDKSLFTICHWIVDDSIFICGQTVHSWMGEKKKWQELPDVDIWLVKKALEERTQLFRSLYPKLICATSPCTWPSNTTKICIRPNCASGEKKFTCHISLFGFTFARACCTQGFIGLHSLVVKLCEPVCVCARTTRWYVCGRHSFRMKVYIDVAVKRNIQLYWHRCATV